MPTKKPPKPMPEPATTARPGPSDEFYDLLARLVLKGEARLAAAQTDV